MIPVRLKVRNFMCYRDNVPPLYFDGIRTACICGDNGNGKSALIDAITWAVWGKARAKSDDELIYSTQADMDVEFDFMVGQQTYRIIRKHSRPKKRRTSGQTILELQIADGDSFKSISGDNQTQTQRKIIDILHMDYDTFINSAFLRQGHADEFTIRKPAERKEVLANILGLSIYDTLEEQARSLAKQRENERDLQESAINDINLELARIPASRAELEAAEKDLDGLDKLRQEHETGLNSLRQEKQALESKKIQLTQLEEHTRNTQKVLERWNVQISQQRSRISEYEAVLSQRADIEAGFARLFEIKQLCHALDQKFREVARLDKQKNALILAITQASQKLVTEHDLIQSKINELELISQKLPAFKNELVQAQTQLSRLSGQEEILRQKRQTSQELGAQIHHLASSQIQLKQEIADIEEKLKLLVAEAGAKCPLCESDLGAEGLKRIEEKFAAEKLNKLEAMKLNQSSIVSKKAELESLNKEISILEIKLDHDRASVQGRISILEKDIASAEEATIKLSEAGKKLADIQERMTKRDFAVPEQEALGRLETELAKLEYDPQRHEEARNQMVSLEQYEAPKRKLEDADRLIDQERNALSAAEEAVKEQSQGLENDNRKRQELEQELSLLPGLTTRLEQAETDYKTLVGRERDAQERVGSARARLEHLSNLELKKKEKGAILAQASKEEGIYKDLARAFGKGGIQAQLIETALPEIEVEANRLLSRMTDNRMHVKFETQKENKKGDTVETLDINISDELGTRNYEMFSGGEAFRINFAIRIALSRLLARRAGAPLPTLIIDEGFGTQDNAGIEKIKEAINSIQDDFEKILVITHIDEIKDAFPTRIEVIKTADGSTIEME